MFRGKIFFIAFFCFLIEIYSQKNGARYLHIENFSYNSLYENSIVYSNDFQLEPIPSLEVADLNQQSEKLLTLTRQLLPNNRSYNLQFPLKYANKKMCTQIYPEMQCSSGTKFRSFDGSCNNLKHKYWGKTNTAFTRLLPAQYSDGIETFRRSVIDGNELPNVRKISLKLFRDKKVYSERYSDAFMAWGQFITHDMTCKIPYQHRHFKIKCCDQYISGLPMDQHCNPILIDRNDEFYSQFNRTCMESVQSMKAPRDDCSLGHAEQLNGCSGYLDGSHIYGRSEADVKYLRAFSNGQLRTWHDEIYGDFLPISQGGREYLCDGDICFDSGDSRANRNIQLTTLHTLFLREHNRIARELELLNPHWDDERIFQETRMIVIAEIQHVTYHEWLPPLIGKTLTKTNVSYNESINGGVLNDFTTAAFRFLHSTVSDYVSLCPHFSVMFQEKLSDHFNRPNLLGQPENFDYLLRGLVTARSGKSDSYFSNEMSEFLFKSTKKFGDDMASIDIHRGRDHGLASYNQYRKLCGLKVATTFLDLSNEISLDNVAILQELYQHVDDIDLMVGGSIETVPENLQAGPTFQCIISEQFYRTRVGDRFFYDNHQTLTRDQIEEIKKVTLSRIICDNANFIDNIQPKAFEIPAQNNQRLNCADLDHIDLDYWKEADTNL